MSRWAERLHSLSRRRDTNDSSDTWTGEDADISLSGTRDTNDTSDTWSRHPDPSVTTVTSVTPARHGETVAEPPSVATVTSVMGADDKETGRFAPVLSGYFLAGLMRPVSWYDPAARPSPGCYCSCCKGQQWWCEATAPKGWRCAICHPPTGLRPDRVEIVRTGLSKEPNKALSRTEATRRATRPRSGK
jgi:hypothetical protein